MNAATKLIQPLQGWTLGGATQGRRWRANPGLYDHNPFGVADDGGDSDV
jgi:hypothetical protein